MILQENYIFNLHKNSSFMLKIKITLLK